MDMSAQGIPFVIAEILRTEKKIYSVQLQYYIEALIKIISMR